MHKNFNLLDAFMLPSPTPPAALIHIKCEQERSRIRSHVYVQQRHLCEIRLDVLPYLDRKWLPRTIQFPRTKKQAIASEVFWRFRHLYKVYLPRIKSRRDLRPLHFYDEDPRFASDLIERVVG